MLVHEVDQTELAQWERCWARVLDRQEVLGCGGALPTGGCSQVW